MTERETQPAPDPVPNGWWPRSTSNLFLLVAATALGIYLCYRIAMPFFSALVWALALAVVFAPVHRRLEAKLKRRNLAALVSVLIVGLIVAVPVTFVVQRLILQAANGAQLLSEKIESGDWRLAIEAHPRLALFVETIGQHVDLPGAVKTLTEGLTQIAKSIVKVSIVELIGFLLTFYLLFFFFRDRRAALQALRTLSPLSEAEMDRLLDRIGDTICAIIYGTLAVSAAQGLLGGLMFWWLGLPGPFLWGVVMAVLAVMPVVGAFLVWIPAVLVLALKGSWVKALILALWGILAVGSVDNLLRPVLVGKRLKLHTVHAFISVVGGVFLFGPAGLILGPVTLTMTVALVDIWRHRREERCG